MRRVMFQLHLWVGVAASLYLLLVCVTGAALLFRPEMQQALYPQLFVSADGGVLADPASVIESVRAKYPQYRVTGIDAPTTARHGYLSYVDAGGRYLTVLIDPVSAQVLGELPDRSAIRTLQSLHFDLLAGATGRKVNGTGAVCLLLLVLSGLVVWSTGRQPWRRRLRVDFGRGWRQVCRDLHSAVAIWVFLPLAMWAFTGFYFAYPSQFRAGVGWISSVSRPRTPSSDAGIAGQAAADIHELLRIAREQRPGMHVARVVLPSSQRGAVQVLFSSQSPTPVGTMALQSVYLDQFSGRVLSEAPQGPRTLGDTVMTWAAPLHVGNFGGAVIRFLWLLLGLVPPLLAFTGVVMWWTRVVRSPMREPPAS
jgi:uncharacterized iron-regulated membrane protein